jgi:hypothetical protein
MNEPALKAAHPHNAARHPQPQRVSPAEALVWLKAGWGYFIGNPGVWIAISVIFIVMLFVLGLVPLLGWAVVLIGFPVMVAGMVLGCHAQARGEPLRIEHLFAGLKVHAGNLALVGVFYLLGGLIAGFVSVVIGGGAALTGYILGALAGPGPRAGQRRGAGQRDLLGAVGAADHRPVVRRPAGGAARHPAPRRHEAVPLGVLQQLRRLRGARRADLRADLGCHGARRPGRAGAGAGAGRHRVFVLPGRLRRSAGPARAGRHAPAEGTE